MQLIEYRSAAAEPLPRHHPPGRDHGDSVSPLYVLLSLASLGFAVAALLGALGLVEVNRPAIQLQLLAVTAAPTVALWYSLVRGLLVARAEARRRDTVEPDLRDFRWSPAGYTAAGAEPWRWLPGLLAATVMLTAFHLGFFTRPPKNALEMLLTLLMFDVFVLFGWRMLVTSFHAAHKFGRTTVAYDRFPMHPGAPMLLRWRSHRRLPIARHGSFTLRCVRWEDGAYRSLWASKQLFAAPSDIPLTGVELRFEPPAELPGTCVLSPGVHWVLEVRLDFPGLDLSEDYPVPVYARA
ncbi:MAG: hypothetical protein JNL82_30055 [Myxococcales bacterium]|nr:hypothetical protein [Myxococcales bacterium]